MADCGDAPRGSPSERRLSKDSRLGTFGGAALFFVLSGAALWHGGSFDEASGLPFGSLLQAEHWREHGLSGCTSPQPDRGLGAALHNGVTRRHDMLARHRPRHCALNGGRVHCTHRRLLVAWLLLSAAQKRMGGVTGDVFGCLIELTESAVLVACCLR
ncbi:MAG: adenosylcobinamide-GDP ribazoletransferase [Bilophila wadsworthia]